MSILGRVFTRPIGPDILGASFLQGIMTATGVFTFLAGALYLPALGPTRIEMIQCLLLLACVALLCTAVGQLTVLIELREKSATNDRNPVDRAR